MRAGLNELLMLAEEDIKWLDDAAQRFEELASQLHEPEKSNWGSRAAAYRERGGSPGGGREPASHEATG